MKILERTGYAGPNVYALYPVCRLTVDLGPLDERFSNHIDGFTGRLLAALPRLELHGCCYGERGGFIRRLHSGTLMGHILEHVAIAVQNIACPDAKPITFGKTRSTGQPRMYHVVYQVRDVVDGLAAADAALDILAHCLPRDLAEKCDLRPASETPDQAIDRFVESVARRALGPSTLSLIEAAEKRAIPWRRLDDCSFIELGNGRYARRLRATVTEHTGFLAAEVAGDKQLAMHLLGESGLPVPRSQLVGSAEEAVRIAEQIGYPVVTKPLDGNHGRGVRTALCSAEQVASGYECARQVRDQVVVQELLVGDDHRLLVVDGQMVAAARRQPAHVIGDGSHTVAQLIDTLNSDPRRGNGHEKSLSRVEVDDEVHRELAAQGFELGSVVPAGTRVVLHAVANLSRGATAHDVTDIVHPDNVRLAERAARLLRLDVAGIDLIVPDISRSWREGGGICEVNAGPGLRMHLAPNSGKPRDVAGPIVDMLFPPPTPVRVPVAALTGTNGKTTTARMLAHIQRCAGLRVGLATTDGVYADGELLEAGDLTGPAGARMALSDPRIDSAVLEVARGGILRAGLGFDQCDVGAVLNVTSDHLGYHGVDTVEDMAFVKRLVVEVASRIAVLNADDEHVVAMAPYCKRARRIIWTSHRADSPIVRKHCEEGGTSLIIDQDIAGAEVISILTGNRRRTLISTADIPATVGGVARFNVSNALAAAAMAHAGGLPASVIAEGLASFHSSFESAPGRLNIYDELPFRVILDYCHNQAAFAALGQMVQGMPVEGRRILVIGLPGNRRDIDLRQSAAEAAKYWDLFVVHDDDDRRGRAPLEVPRIIEGALREAGVAEQNIAVTEAGEVESTEIGLRLARPGDLLVVLAISLEKSWRAIVDYRYGDLDRLEQSSPAASP